MNHAQCGDVKPSPMFGSVDGTREIRCTKRLGHAWDHSCETLPGEPSWPQLRVLGADDLAKLLEAFKADPGAFKSLGCVVVHCRCKELDP